MRGEGGGVTAARSARPGRVLIIAGSDSGGGAGIQADIKTVTMLGGFAMTAVTAVTVQNTLGVSRVHPVPPDIVAEQIAAVADDIGVDAIKIGMLGDAATIRAVAEAILSIRAPVVLDPVMVAKGGAALLQDDAVAVLKEALLPRATVLTPNLPELEALTGQTLGGADVAGEMRAAARALLAAGPQAVLAKGGHLEGPDVVDWLVTIEGDEDFHHPRLETPHTHGTGCTLSSALATGMAAGLPLRAAVGQALAFVQAALRAAPGFGHGHGPMGHAAVRLREVEAWRDDPGGDR